MKPKRYPYSGNKKQPHEEIAIKVNELKAEVASVTSRTNQIFSRIVGDTKISLNNNGVELEEPKIIAKEQEMKVSIEITNLSDFLELAKEVVKKAEELETAVQRLNNIELELQLQTKTIDE